jgi:hypothetical protein
MFITANVFHHLVLKCYYSDQIKASEICQQFKKYVEVSKIFQTDAVKIIILTIRPIGRYHPRSSSHPHVDTGPTISIFGMLPGSPFLSDCQALSVIRPGSPQWYQIGFSFIFGNRKKSQGAKSGEYSGWGIIAIL